MQQFQVLLFYKYVPIEDPAALRLWQIELGTKYGLRGRVIVATEGINATLEGTKENTELYLKEYLADPRFSDTHIKRSVGTGDDFPRLSVKVRADIISSSAKLDVDPRSMTGKRLSPDELHAWYAAGKNDFYIVDMRNDYELKVGQFEGTIFPGLQNFRDLTIKKDEIAHLKDKTVLTVCTGGVRCEKASGYLVKEGFKDVYQLDGGIVSFMEKYPGEGFKGSLYVFDKRKTVHFDTPETHTVIGRCDLCGSNTENYENCTNNLCHLHFLLCENCKLERGGEPYCSDDCKRAVDASKISS